jgi:hypothetical protein
VFDEQLKEPFLARFNLNGGRLTFLIFSTLGVCLLALAFAASTGNKGMRMLAMGLFGISLYLSLLMSGIGVAISSVVFVRRQPYLFWICSTAYAFIPFVFAIVLS